MDQFKVLKIPELLYDQCAEIARGSGVKTDDMIIGLIAHHAKQSQELIHQILHGSPVDQEGNLRQLKPQLDVEQLEHNARTIEDCMIKVVDYLDSILNQIRSSKKRHARQQI